MSQFFNHLFTPSGLRGKKPNGGSGDYAQVVARTAAMVRERKARRLAKKRKLRIVDLTWEDTGRYKGSCVGPNISDMTIQVQHEDRITCMPVIRHPNFSDRTADVSVDDVFLRVGNEKGRPLKRVSLRKYLGNLRRYLSEPGSWAGKGKSLLSPREREVLVSAQACFLPVPKQGEATFNPVLFNYQSYAGAPAVLAIVATREGTSATIIDNERDAFGAGAAWGQRLFFNQDGERASFTGTRLEEFVAAGGDDTDAVTDLESARSAGLNCVLLIQVPLKQPEPRFRTLTGTLAGCAPSALSVSKACFAEEAACDIDEAVIGHGEVEGPYTEIDDLPMERDGRFPIRVTVQFYKATSNGVVSESEMKVVADQIEAIYADARAVGSLVTDADSGRSTEWDDEGHGKAEPADWWQRFWNKQERVTGKSQEQLLAELERLLGRRPLRSELEDAVRRVFGADG